MNKKIQIVNTKNVPIGSGTMIDAWSKGLYHQIVRVILRDDNGNILLQKRGQTMEVYPNRWTDSASGHVDFNENPETAAERELYEELGLTAQLKFIGIFLTRFIIEDKKVNTYNLIFTGLIDSNATLNVDPIEVSDTRWFKIEKLKNGLLQNPETFTPYLARITEKYL